MTEKPTVVIHDNSLTLSSVGKSVPAAEPANPLPAELQTQLTNAILSAKHLSKGVSVAGSNIRYFETDEQAVAFMRKQKPQPLTLSVLKEMGRNRKKRTAKKTKR